MPLWKLNARRIGTEHAWSEPWDKAYGFVVRARTADNARLVASKNAGEEGGKAWLDPAQTTCDPLTVTGPEEVVLCDFDAG